MQKVVEGIKENMQKEKKDDVELSVADRCQRVLQSMCNCKSTLCIDDMMMDVYADRVLGDDIKFQDGMMYLYRTDNNTWTETTISVKRVLVDHLICVLLNPLLVHIEGMHGTSKADKAAKHRVLKHISRQAYAGYLASRLLLRLATQPKVVFDKEHLNELQYRNGVFDMQTRLFRERTKTDYICETLAYDFMSLPQIPEHVATKVEDIFVKIQPDPEERRIQLSFLAHAIAGSVGNGSRYKINVGKTPTSEEETESKIMRACFPLYVITGYWITTQSNQLRFLLSAKRRSPFRLVVLQEAVRKPVNVALVKELVTSAPTHGKFSAHPRLMWLTSNTHWVPTWMLGQQQQYMSSNNEWFNDEMFTDPVYKNAFLHLLLQYLV